MFKNNNDFSIKIVLKSMLLKFPSIYSEYDYKIFVLENILTKHNIGRTIYQYQSLCYLALVIKTI